jgi:hypothetical protein
VARLHPVHEGARFLGQRHRLVLDPRKPLARLDPCRIPVEPNPGDVIGGKPALAGEIFERLIGPGEADRSLARTDPRH